MSANQPSQTVGRFEFSIVAGQLFLFVGLLALATTLPTDEAFTNLLVTVLKFILMFASFGMSLFCGIAANRPRSNKSPPSDTENQGIDG